MTVCYDLRFPHLYRDLAQAGAEVLTRALGLHRADRARRTGTCCCGRARSRPAPSSSRRRSPGRIPRRRAGRGRPTGTASRSSPWGEVLADAGEGSGVVFVEIDPAEVARARAMVPSLGHDRDYAAGRPTCREQRGGQHDPAVIALFSEIVMVETLARNRLTRALPRGMELSHFMVLNHFARLGGEKTPAQLARVFHVTKGAMTNTVGAARRRRLRPRPPRLGGRPAQAGLDQPRRACRPRPGGARRSRRSSTTWWPHSASSGCGRPCRRCGGSGSCSTRTDANGLDPRSAVRGEIARKSPGWAIAGQAAEKASLFWGWNPAGKWLESGLPLFKIPEGFRQAGHPRNPVPGRQGRALPRPCRHPRPRPSEGPRRPADHVRRMESVAASQDRPALDDAPGA